MKNCIIAQSGGPTAVINASAIGIYEKNLELDHFNKIYFGLNGIEGILHENILDTSNMSKEDIINLKYTPSSGLGSCRYKLKDFRDCEDDYIKVISVLEKLNIDTFFYIGGNDSMDTVYKFSQFCKDKDCSIKFIGIPKTIDNDLFGTDHCPGYGSAAKLISTLVLETYLDSSVYRDNGIFIVETMGRDTGWLTAAAALSKIDNKCVADLIYVPEVAFDIDKFLKDVQTIYNRQNQVYIVVSEGIRDSEGNFIAETESLSHDKFGHKQLGGVCNALKQLIVNSGITSRVKTLELGVIQRCAMHCISRTDLHEAWEVGAYGLTLAIENKTGVMACIIRQDSAKYNYSFGSVDISQIANKTKFFPTEWVNEEQNHIKDIAIDYIQPLIQGIQEVPTENGLPRLTIIRN